MVCSVQVSVCSVSLKIYSDIGSDLNASLVFHSV